MAVQIKALFSKEGRRKRALEKAIARASNAKIKPDDRRPALYQLMEDGSDEAIAGLLNRLSFNYDTNIVADEEEKHYVYEGLVSMGDRIAPLVVDYVRRSPSISWGLKLLQEVCEPEQTWTMLAGILADYEPGYQRDPSRKQQLLTALSQFEHPRVPEAIAPFIEDHDETVRLTAIDTLINRGEDEMIREPLIKRLIDEEEDSQRVRNRIIEGLTERGISVKGYRSAVEQVLPDGYTVDGKGRMKKKKGRSG